ncbi:MAG: hypothetical protein GX554_00425, partial [Elusimicrobia bacterium]|nr:hypothetical protein [Elusimicrobiota bacterium]
TLTISSGTGGSISTPGAGTYQYDYGTVVPIKAVANTGYHFVAWTGNTGTIANTSAAETTITMNGNYTITATFAIDAGGTQTLNISAGTGGKITTPAAGVHTYNSGAVISIKATPSAGYLFVAWIGDTATIANVNSAETTITMEGNYSITATFAKTTQTLKLLKGTGCSSTTPTASITYTYSYGAIVPIKAVPLTGYDFVAWTGAINTVADPYSAETTVTMLGSYTITATFAKTKHTLTISAGPGGSITVPGSGTYQYDYGTSVSIRAVADTGYQFLAWTGDVERITSGTSTSTYIKMEGNYTITATFVKKTYTLSMYNKTGGYSLSPGGKTSHEYETEVPIKAVPETGYHFVAWTGSISEIDDVNAAETKITMLNNYTIYPSFAKDIHTLTISADPGGSITYPSGGAGMYSYNYGTSVSIRATPATGYKFVAWTGDIDNITNSAAASTYIKMEGNYTIKATFAPK